MKLLLMGMFCLILGCVPGLLLGQDQEVLAFKAENPIPYENIKGMVERVWGTDDQKNNGYMIKLHCSSLSRLMRMEMDSTHEAIFEKALTKWSQAREEDRVERWWEWPDTNWMKVESEFRFMLDEKKE